MCIISKYNPFGLNCIYLCTYLYHFISKSLTDVMFPSFTATVTIRLLIFPIIIRAQKNGIKMQEHLPEMQRLQAKVGEF